MGYNFMKNTIFIGIAFLVGYVITTSFISSEKETSFSEQQFRIQTTHYTSSEVSEKKDYYEDYLHELNSKGPKEEGRNSTASSEVLTSSLILSTQNNSGNEYQIPAEPEVIIEKPHEEITKKVDEVGIVDHKPFGKLLQKYVDSKGNVNYKGFKNDEAALDAYLDQLRQNPVSSSMSKNERLAYWINVYNAFTIKLILENYPIKSIMDIDGGKPWDRLFIKLGQTTYSLNMVENEIIRKRFPEPRIHFAVNCAAKSCPPLLNDAFYPNQLISQLAKQTTAFVRNNSYNTITESKLEVSKIFDWYGVDFGDVKQYIGRNSGVDLSGVSLSFKEYDWSLNQQ